MLCQRGPRLSPSSHQLEHHFAYQVDSGTLLAYSQAYTQALFRRIGCDNFIWCASCIVLWCFVTLATTICHVGVILAANRVSFTHELMNVMQMLAATDSH